MADTVEIFVGGLPLDHVQQRIHACTGLNSRVDQYGTIDYLHEDFIAALSPNEYVEGDEVDTSAYEFELSAKNYWEPEVGGKLDSPTVEWFRVLFSCLSSYDDCRLLMTYNYEYALNHFEPSTD